MEEKLGVRVLIYDKKTNRYVKALMQSDLSDFIDRFALQKSNSPVTLYNFDPVIEKIHENLKSALVTYRHEEIQVKYSAIYNDQQTLKHYTKPSVIEGVGIKINSNVEEIVNWLHTRLNTNKSAFYHANEVHPKNQGIRVNNSYENLPPLKTTVFNDILCDCDLFIQSTLCRIHATLMMDVDYFKHDVIVRGHIEKVYGLLVSLLREVAGVHPNGSLAHENIIEDLFMTQHNIDPAALLQLTECKSTAEDILRKITQVATNIENNGNRDYFVRKFQWSYAEPIKIDRTKEILKRIQRCQSIYYILELLKTNEIDYSINLDELKQLSSDIDILMD